MNNNEQVLSCADMITRVFTNIEKSDIENGNKVVGAWRRTVESIRPNGKNIAAHSQIIDLKNGLLLIEADHPGWIQLLQMHQRYVLTGLKRMVPELKIHTLTFRLKGSKAELADVDTAAGSRQAQERERKWLERQLDREQAEIEKQGFVPAAPQSQKKLPPELESLFNRFKSEMKND